MIKIDELWWRKNWKSKVRTNFWLNARSSFYRYGVGFTIHIFFIKYIQYVCTNLDKQPMAKLLTCVTRLRCMLLDDLNWPLRIFQMIIVASSEPLHKVRPSGPKSKVLTVSLWPFKQSLSFLAFKLKILISPDWPPAATSSPKGPKETHVTFSWWTSLKTKLWLLKSRISWSLVKRLFTVCLVLLFK